MFQVELTAKKNLAIMNYADVKGDFKELVRSYLS